MPLLFSKTPTSQQRLRLVSEVDSIMQARSVLPPSDSYCESRSPTNSNDCLLRQRKRFALVIPLIVRSTWARWHEQTFETHYTNRWKEASQKVHACCPGANCQAGRALFIRPPC